MRLFRGDVLFAGFCLGVVFLVRFCVGVVLLLRIYLSFLEGLFEDLLLFWLHRLGALCFAAGEEGKDIRMGFLFDFIDSGFFLD